MKTFTIQTKKTEVQYQDPFQLYKKLSNSGNSVSLLMESRSVNLRYGKRSIIVPNPAVTVVAGSETFSLHARTDAGKAILRCFSQKDFSYADDYSQDDSSIRGTVKKEENLDAEESSRRRQKNVSFVVRTILQKFSCDNLYAGLYGSIAYDFAKNYYSCGSRFLDASHNDVILFIPTVVYAFDDIREKAERLEFSFNGACDKEESTSTEFLFEKQQPKTIADMTEAEYRAKVAEIIADIKRGRAMQCVFSRKISVALQHHPLESYQVLREANPSPYSFFFNLGDGELLYGASPERHITIENNNIEIRPIAGTIQRSANPLEDAQARIQLLTDEKETREHTMLVDLARHELYGLSEPGSVVVSDLFTLETYPNLYHLVSGVTGKLKKGVDAVDALLITLPAGTLSGAPKREAMKMIDEYESSRRGFYGGAVGYLSFNGDCNTGITIRSVHVKGQQSHIRSGGGIVALSTPEGELAETKLKMEKIKKTLGMG